MGVGKALIGAGTVLGIGGSLLRGKMTEKEMERQRGYALEESRELAKEVEERVEETTQRQKLAYIKSGIELTPDSPLLMLTETRARGEEEIQKILRGGRIQASQYARFGRQALTGGVSQAAQYGLYGAGQLYGSRK